MAAALLGSVPVAILYAFFLEYYVKGMNPWRQRVR